MIYRISPAAKRDLGDIWRIRASRDSIEIFRVLHGRMDVKRQFDRGVVNECWITVPACFETAATRPPQHEVFPCATTT